MNNFNPSQQRMVMTPQQPVPQPGMGQPQPNMPQSQDIVPQIHNILQQTPVNPQIIDHPNRVRIVAELFTSQMLVQGNNMAARPQVFWWAVNIERRIATSTKSAQEYMAGIHTQMQNLHVQRQKAATNTAFPNNGMPAQTASNPAAQNTLARNPGPTGLNPQPAPGFGRGHPNQERATMLNGQPAGQFGNAQQPPAGNVRPPVPANVTNQSQPSSTPSQIPPQPARQTPQPNNVPQQINKQGQQAPSRNSAQEVVSTGQPQKNKQILERSFQLLLGQQLEKNKCKNLEELKAKMNIPPQTRVEAQREGMDPVVYSLHRGARAFAVQQIRKEQGASGRSGESVQSANPSASEPANSIDPSKFVAAQDSAKRSAEAGDLVVPASDNQTLQRNVGNRNISSSAFGNNGTIGGGPGGFQAQPRPFPSQPAAQRQNIPNNSDQGKAKGQPPRPASTVTSQAPQPRPPSAAAMLQGQPGGLHVVQQNQQPSPGMHMLNKPFGPGPEQNAGTPQRPAAQGVQRSQQASPQPGPGPSQMPNQGAPRNPPTFAPGVNQPPAQGAQNQNQNQNQMFEHLLNTHGPSAFAQRFLSAQNHQFVAQNMKSEEHGKEMIKSIFQSMRPNSNQAAHTVPNSAAQSLTNQTHPNVQPSAPASQASMHPGLSAPSAQRLRPSIAFDQVADQSFPRHLASQRLSDLQLPDNLRLWKEVRSWMEQNRANISQEDINQLVILAQQHCMHLSNTAKDTRPVSNQESGQKSIAASAIESTSAYQKGLIQIGSDGEVEIKPPTQEEIYQLRNRNPQLPPQSIVNQILASRFQGIKSEDESLAMRVYQRHFNQQQQRQNAPRVPDAPTLSAPQQGPQGQQGPQSNPMSFAGVSSSAIPPGIGGGQQGGQQPPVSRPNTGVQGPQRVPSGMDPSTNSIQNNQSQMLPPNLQNNVAPGPHPQSLQGRAALGQQNSMRPQAPNLSQIGMPPGAMAGNQATTINQAQNPVRQVNGQTTAPRADSVGSQLEMIWNSIPTRQTIQMNPAQYARLGKRFKQFGDHQQHFVASFQRVFEAKGQFDDDFMGLLKMFVMLQKQLRNGQFEPNLPPQQLEAMLNKFFGWAQQQQGSKNVSNAANTNKTIAGAPPQAPQNKAPTTTSEPSRPPAPSASSKATHTRQAPSMEKKPSTKKASAKAPPAPTSSQPPQSFPNPDPTTGHPKTGDGRPKYPETRSELSFSPDNLSIPDKKKKKPNRVGEVAAQTPPAATPGSTGSPQPTPVAKQDNLPPSSQQETPAPPKKDLPFKCPISFCDAEVEGFVSSDQLNDHVQREHGEGGGPFDCISGNEQDALPKVGVQCAPHLATMDATPTGATKRSADAGEQENADESAKRQKTPDGRKPASKSPVGDERRKPSEEEILQEMLDRSIEGLPPLQSYYDAVQVEPSGPTETPELTPDRGASDDEEDMTGLCEEEKRLRRRKNMSIEERSGPDAGLKEHAFLTFLKQPGRYWGPTLDSQPPDWFWPWYERQKKLDAQNEERVRIREARARKAGEAAAAVKAPPGLKR